MDQVPWGTRASLPSAVLAWCLAGRFECCHVISNDSEDFCNVFYYYYHSQKKEKKTRERRLLKQAWNSPAPQNCCI